MQSRTYKELQSYVKAFDEGHVRLMVVESLGGLGKSELAKVALTGEYRIFNTKATPIAIAEYCIEHPDAKIVLDDCDSFFTAKDAIPVAKTICDTGERQLTWLTKQMQLSGKINNSVLILTNNMRKLSDDMKALLTRGIFIHFSPNNKEVFLQLQEWAEDVEILGYLKHIPEGIALNFRMYCVAAQLKEAKLDWVLYLQKEHSIPPDYYALHKVKGLSRNARDKEWVRLTGKTPRTLYRLLKKAGR